MIDLLCPACGERTPELNPRCRSCGSLLPFASDEVPAVSPSADTVCEAPRVLPDPLLGSKVGRFLITSRLGQGGMGVVYRAEDLELGREVALKFLSPGRVRAQDEARFRREAQAAASLDHPNVGTIHEVGEHQGRRFLALAFYEGETLAERLDRARQEPLPLAEAVAIGSQLASALSAAHAAGVIHRDLKPSNVMLTRGGRVKLLDFGLARAPGASDLTESGIAVGTVAYMSPEQLQGEEIDARTDLWALGVVLYEMLAGRHPFLDETAEAAKRGVARAILQQDPPQLSTLRPEVPEDLAQIVHRCLAKDPDARPASAEEVFLALGSFLPASGTASPSSSAATKPLLTRPRRLEAAVLAGAVLLLLGAAAVLWRQRQPAGTLYVAVAKSEVAGAIEGEEQALVAANLQAAALRALTALEGIAPLDATRETVGGTVVDLARATAAQEVLTARADCSRSDMCQLTLQRLSGKDGRVLWADTFRTLGSQSRLLAETVASSVRQAYPSRKPRLDLLELRVDNADFDRYLDLRRKSDTQEASADELMEEVRDLRRGSPSFVEAYVFESSLARQQLVATGERKYLELGLAAALQAQELAPEDPRPLSALFDLHLEAGQVDEAEESLKQMEQLQINPEELLYRQARLEESRGDHDQALQRMREAVALLPSWRYLLYLANMEYRLGRLGEARQHLDELLARAPGNVWGLQTLAQVELLEGNPERAVKLLQEVTQRTPEAGSLTNLGLALLLLRRYHAAAGSFRHALALDADNLQSNLNMADCLWLLGRRGEAGILYRDIIKRVDAEGSRSQWVPLSAQAQALAHLGERPRAVAVIHEALRLTPDNAQLAFEASLVYILVEDRSSALVYAEKAVKSGVNKLWFGFPWFDPLRQDPTFASLTRS